MLFQSSKAIQCDFQVSGSNQKAFDGSSLTFLYQWPCSDEGRCEEGLPLAWVLHSNSAFPFFTIDIDAPCPEGFTVMPNGKTCGPNPMVYKGVNWLGRCQSFEFIWFHEQQCLQEVDLTGMDAAKRTQWAKACNASKLTTVRRYTASNIRFSGMQSGHAKQPLLGVLWVHARVIGC